MRLLLAAPKGPPYGGMTANTSVWLKSRLAADNRIIFFDTTPPAYRGRKIPRLLYSLKQFGRLFSVLRSQKPEAAYLMSSSFAGFYEKGAMALLCRWMRVPAAVHLVGGGFDAFYRRSALGKPLIAGLLKTCGMILTVSESWKDFVRTIAPRQKIVVIPNPVRTDLYARPAGSPAGKNGVQILFIGKLVKDKGVLDIIEAVSRKRDLYRGARIIFLGNGELDQECGRRIRDRGLDEIFSLAGYVDDEAKIRYLKTSDIFLLPSYFEGVPVAILEAMASGLPVVSTHAGGIPSTVRDGETGYLIHPGDLDALNEKMGLLIRDRSLRVEMGERGRRLVRREFDADVVAGRLDDALRSLIPESRREAPRRPD